MYIVNEIGTNKIYLPKSSFGEIIADGLISFKIERSDDHSIVDAQINFENLGENYIRFSFNVVDNEISEDLDNGVYYLEDGQYEFIIRNRRLLISVELNQISYY